MDLKNLIKKDVKIELPYQDADLEGFLVTLSYVPRQELQKIRKKCLKISFNKKTHLQEEQLDDEMFLELYVNKVISGWKGLKYKYLQEFLPVDITAVDPEVELEYSPENALELMKNSQVFDSWITSNISDITNFNKNYLSTKKVK